MTENNDNGLCLNAKYDKYTKKDVPDTQEWKEDYEAHKDIEMTLEEFYVIDKFYDEHRNCFRLPDGRSRFGAIGGGFEKYIRIPADDSECELFAKCYGCDTVINVTEKCKEVNVAEIPDSVKEKYECYNKLGNFNDVEYLRYNKFIEDHKGHNITLGFMGTGLGWLIMLKDEDNSEYAGIADTTCW